MTQDTQRGAEDQKRDHHRNDTNAQGTYVGEKKGTAVIYWKKKGGHVNAQEGQKENLEQ